jgi:hypothetical protein
LSAKTKSKRTPEPPAKSLVPMTTIAISVENQKELDKMRRGRESFDDILSRLMSGQFDFYIEFLLIDNELPSLHTAAFQLGTDTDSVFYFDGQHSPRESTPQEINRFMKFPKPTFTLTREEVRHIFPMIQIPDDVKGSELSQNLENRMKEFLNQRYVERGEPAK